MNKKIQYLIFILIGMIIGGWIVNFYYNNFLLENQFRNEIMMTKIDGKILELLDSGNIEEAQNMLSLKYDLELTSIETEWAIRDDSIYKDILFSKP